MTSHTRGSHYSFVANRTACGWPDMFSQCLGVRQWARHDGHAGFALLEVLSECTDVPCRKPAAPSRQMNSVRGENSEFPSRLSPLSKLDTPLRGRDPPG